MIPKQLQNPGFRFNLLKARDKIPFEDEWQKKGYSYDSPGLIGHIKNGGNYGIIGGYNRLRLLDIDEPSFVPEIEKVLKTFSVKTGKGGRHFYLLSDYDKNHVLAGGKGELRGNMQFVVAPGSIHPNGNKYEVVDDLPLLEVSEEELSAVLRPIFKTEVLAKVDYGKMLKGEAAPGERNDGYFRTACLFRFQRIPIDTARELISAANEKNKNPISQAELDRVVKNAYGYDGEVTKKPSKLLLKIDNYLDNAKAFYELQPYFYDKAGIFWFWRDNKWGMVDDTEVERSLDSELGFMGQTVTSTVRHNHLTAIRWYGREKNPAPAKIHWIQFKNKAFSINSGNIYEVTPDYFFCNPIPHEIGETSDTPTLDKLFADWVGEENIQRLYEIIAYCCYPAYPIQTLFCFYGRGRNGKTCFLKVLSKFIGMNNICSTELDLIVGQNSSRFETAKLYKKMVCTMGETNFGILNKSSILKKLTGGDLLGFEMKGKTPFDDVNYAKIIIASNSLPTSDDTSDGFYRRWIIIDFPNQFPEGKDITETIPEREYFNLSRKVIDILPGLLAAGTFTGQGTIEERRNKYIMSSNPLPYFIETYCDNDAEGFIRYSELYMAYVGYLKQKKLRIISKKEFSSALTEEGYEIRRTTKTIDEMYQTDRWIEGIRWNTNYDRYAGYTKNPTQEKHHIGRSGKQAITGISVINSDKTPEEEVLEECFLPCSSCAAKPGSKLKIYFDRAGTPKCEVCLQYGDNQ